MSCRLVATDLKLSILDISLYIDGLLDTVNISISPSPTPILLIREYFLLLTLSQKAGVGEWIHLCVHSCKCLMFIINSLLDRGHR